MTHDDRDRAPHHGDRGGTDPAPDGRPGGMTVAVSRQVGARGGSVARRVGRALGWPVYDRDQLELLAADDTSLDLLRRELSPEQRRWSETLLARLGSRASLNDGAFPAPLSAMLAGLAARGGTVLVGRGAGWLLPRASTLHVHVVAPPEDRVAHMAEHLRLGHEAAGRHVAQRQQGRADFLAATLKHGPREEDFDLVLNSATLHEDGTARTILLALGIKARHAGLAVPDVPGLRA